MKILKPILLLLVFLTTSFYGFSQGKLPESLEMEKLNGAKVKLKYHAEDKGKITVICFWATWDKTSKQQLDYINNDNLESWKNDYDIEFIAVSMDNTRTKFKVKGVVDTKGWEFDVLIDPHNSAYQSLGFNSVPYTLLLDAKGNIVYKHIGYRDGDEYELEDQIAKIAR